MSEHPEAYKEEIEYEKLKTFTDGLMRHVYYVEHDFPLQPSKKHHLTAINFTDTRERKDDFLKAIINTVTSWVYNKSEIARLRVELQIDSGGDEGFIADSLSNAAKRKFRPGHPQGQFGELLLFNFLQHFFHALPVLRKQKITTNTNLERNGADAIHYKKDKGFNILILGESKCYESKYQFAPAFKQSLQSIKTTYETLDKELDLFTFEDFIEPSLKNVVKAYKNGQLQNVKYQLVCLIIYHEQHPLSNKGEKENKEEILKIIEAKCKALKGDTFNDVKHIVEKLHYIIFPVWALDTLLDDFQTVVGTKA